MGSDEKPKYTSTFVLCVLMCVFAGSFQYGFNISSVNGPAEFVKDRLYPIPPEIENCTLSLYDSKTEDIPLNPQPCDERNVTDKDIFPQCRCTIEQEKSLNDEILSQDDKFSFAVAIFTVGGIVGSFSTGFLVTKFGRKNTQMINMFLSIAAGGLYMGAFYMKSSIMLIIARILVGAFAGLATGVCPMYILELSPASIRGAVGVLSQLFITIGLLTAQIIAFPQLMGKPDLWGWFFALTAVPAILWLIASPKMVETPRYTLLERDDRDQAEKDLKLLRGTDVKEEMDEMEADSGEDEADVEQMTVIQLFTDKTVRWQIIIIIVSQMGQQLCGINAVFFYTNKIFTAAGFDNETSTMISALVGLENVIMTFVSMALMDKMGRKSLQVYGYIIITFFCVAMTVCLNMLDASPVIPYLCIACVLGYIVGFAIGPGPVPWIWNSEFFNQRARGPAGSVSCALNWTSTFLVGKFFPPLQNAMGAYVFIIFAGVAAFVTVFLIKFAPETKGKSFEEIEAEFEKMNGVKNEEATPMKAAE